MPQVARAQVALGVRGDWERFKAGGEWRYIGRQFDDDRNEFPLNRAPVLDGPRVYQIDGGSTLRAFDMD